MKKSLIFLIALCFVMSAQAQLYKGRMLLGGSLTFNYNKTDKTDTRDSTGLNTPTVQNTLFSVSARYGYFLTNHLAVGVLGGFSTAQTNTTWNVRYQNYSSEGKQITNTYSAGLFARYYQMIGKSRFAVFGQLAATYGAGSGKYSVEYTPNINMYPGQEIHNDNYAINVYFNPGLTYFISDYFSVEATVGTIGYGFSDSKAYAPSLPGQARVMTNETKNYSANASLSLSSISLGFNFYFGGSKNRPPVPVKQ